MGTFIHTGDNRVKKQMQDKNKAKKQNFGKCNSRRLTAVLHSQLQKLAGG
jgi:hypothetical protein